MIALGDIHGDMDALRDAYLQTDGALIQVGDFGFSRDSLAWLRNQKHERPVYLMDGNHEHHLVLPTMAPGLHPIAPNCWYVGRGTVATIGGMRIGFMGGGCSIDKNFRLRHGWHWSELEVVTDAQVDTLLSQVRHAGPLDLLITHQPPESLIQAHFDPMDKLRLFGVPVDWIGAGSSVRLDRLWDRLGRPPLICGHMHRTVNGDGYTMLDVREVREIVLTSPPDSPPPSGA